MALIFQDGFDWYTTADFTKRWTYGSGLNVSPTAARAPSGQGIIFTGASSTTYCYKSFGANYTQGVFGFAFNAGATAFASKTIAVILDGTTEQCSIRTNASSVLTVTQNGTVKATGSTVLAQSTWYYIEFKFTIHGSAGVAEVKLNGVSEIASTTSLDLTGTAANQWNGVQFAAANSSWATEQFDDAYVLDTSTGSNTNFLGPVRVVAVNPSAPGNYAQWTPNGGTNQGNVSELFEDGDTSFNQSSTANQIDSFVMQDLPVSTGSVYSLTHLVVARQDAGAARTLAAVSRIAGTDYVGATKSLSTSYQFLETIYDLSPATASAWTPAEVAGLEAGYKLIS